MKHLGILVLLAGAILAFGAAPASATSECRGLPVCVRVAGPWVVVPGGSAVPRPRVEFQLSCPRGFVVGGLDAELSDRAIELGFLGKLGSPVGPGVTTSRSVVFVATYVGSAGRTPTFRAHLGCLPATGGGAGPVPFRLSAAFPPGEPTVRRVRTAALRQGQTRAVAACAAGERLISGWHAVGFYTSAAPTPELIQSVVATRKLRNARVEATVRAGPAVRGVRAIVQVGAVCGGGQ